MDYDVLLNKTSIIERCLQHVREEFKNDPALDIVQSVVQEHLSGLTRFTERVLATDGFRSEE